MKKIILILAIIVSTSSAFASNPIATKAEKNVTQKVLDAFHTEFSTATNVEWSVGENYYLATFNYNEKYVFAYFNDDAELLGVTRYIKSDNLPIFLQASLKKNYDDYWITDLIEVAKYETTYYYITLENADTKLVLKSSGGSNWSVHDKARKL